MSKQKQITGTGAGSVTGSNSDKIQIIEQVTHQKIKCLIYAAYLAGQEAGLNSLSYDHPECIAERHKLVEMILKNI